MTCTVAFILDIPDLTPIKAVIETEYESITVNVITVNHTIYYVVQEHNTSGTVYSFTCNFIHQDVFRVIITFDSGLELVAKFTADYINRDFLAKCYESSGIVSPFTGTPHTSELMEDSSSWVGLSAPWDKVLQAATLPSVEQVDPNTIPNEILELLDPHPTNHHDLAWITIYV